MTKVVYNKRMVKNLWINRSFARKQKIHVVYICSSLYRYVYSILFSSFRAKRVLIQAFFHLRFLYTILALTYTYLVKFWSNFNLIGQRKRELTKHRR